MSPFSPEPSAHRANPFDIGLGQTVPRWDPMAALKMPAAQMLSAHHFASSSVSLSVRAANTAGHSKVAKLVRGLVTRRAGKGSHACRLPPHVRGDFLASQHKVACRPESAGIWQTHPTMTNTPPRPSSASPNNRNQNNDNH
jgi:hypothetical protein